MVRQLVKIGCSYKYLISTYDLKVSRLDPQHVQFPHGYQISVRDQIKLLLYIQSSNYYFFSWTEFVLFYYNGQQRHLASGEVHSLSTYVRLPYS